MNDRVSPGGREADHGPALLPWWAYGVAALVVVGVLLALAGPVRRGGRATVVGPVPAHAPAQQEGQER